MLQSVANVHADCDLFYLIVEKNTIGIPSENGFSVVSLQELQIPDHEKMAFAYGIAEFNTAVKPFFLSFLFSKGYQKVIYLDPDIFVYNRLDTALQALDTFSIILTPHSLHPDKDPVSFLDTVQWEQSMECSGVFNLGFLGLSKTSETMEFLDWWKKRCRFLCIMEPQSGIYVDQKWAELAIAYWDHVYILRDPGYNVSVWNLHERTLSGLSVNGNQPLVFYHFSSIDINNDSIISKHVKNYSFEQYPALVDIFTNYRSRVKANGYSHFVKIPYSYGFFSGGHPIDLLERRLYAMVAERYGDPFESNQKTFYKNIKQYAHDVRFQPPVQNLPLLIKIAPWIFRFIGPERYRRFVTLLAKAALLRNHTFLLK